MVAGGGRKTRKPHPYFGYRAKGTVVELRVDGRRSPHEPSMTPEQEEGSLWAAFRPGPRIVSTDT